MSQLQANSPPNTPHFLPQFDSCSESTNNSSAVKRSRDHTQQSLNNQFQTLTCDSYPQSPPRTPLGSLSHDLSTHVNLSEKKEHLDHIEPQPKRRSSAKLDLNDFTFIRTLGTGSFGRVHLAQSVVNKQYCAIKVLKKRDIVNARQVEHTKNERAVLVKMKDNFMVNLWGTFQDDTNLYMVLDFVAGGELFSLMRKRKKFDEDTARFYAAEVLLAICHLHQNNIIYRDLKPENILLDAQGHIKLTDFGFAKVVPDITWTLCGTPDYLAPEIIQSKGYGKAVDFWALGVLIYEMLSGVAPFYDDNQFRLYEKIITCKPVYPSHFSPEATDLLKHLLTPDLSSRYGNLKGGPQDLIQHPWFQPIDFDQLAKRQIKPPYIPQVKEPGDSSNFDHYEEEKVPYGQPQHDPFRKYFTEF
ncbi:hypothetical protein G6F70_007273 [Rhizopus microsporus]|uniref:cAMP-dependent protein kinase n=1 Tax=Rhizopus azygosporus TaxID=86630 RepID=A0A367JTK7_RHIAZ|nr:hypothetical protein G6F71_007290 [Rhizopus microsporus]RCH93248.1 camp-dependent protein kinase catalytic subunit [Rhizopus azygosporus]KAG1196650.1 hypothetical protein G6F70_007273 [Rhizopus microsporus]KAG1208411.1 hypothetical protein G6F69_007238 [Rhizopus microsporus]KAG1229293.1 hypothetical protein G6F67_007252 [Rhizopus microsporus]